MSFYIKKLFDTNEKLPEKSGFYLCVCHGVWRILCYSAKYKLFNAHDEFDYKCALGYSLHVTHWTMLPPIPKEIESL